jgi:hypothetical protein
MGFGCDLALDTALGSRVGICNAGFRLIDFGCRLAGFLASRKHAPRSTLARWRGITSCAEGQMKDKGEKLAHVLRRRLLLNLTRLDN